MAKTEEEDLARKWGILAWLKIRIDNDPAFLKKLVLPLLNENKLAKQGVCDLAFVAPTSAAEWKQKARRLKPAIDPDGVIWIIFPKEGYREKYNFDGSLPEMVSIVRELRLKQTKLAAVNEELTSVRFSIDHGDNE